MGDLGPSLVFALALGAGIVCQILAAHLRVPSIVLLLAAGFALGPEGLDLIRPATLGQGLFGLVGLGVAVILFEGGLNLEVARLRREGGAIRRLVTSGAAITAAGGALAARLWMGWSWPQSVMFGTLVVVTGPTVIGPLLRSLRVRPKVSTVLEAEGVLIDPIGAILAALTLEVVVRPSADSFTAGLLGLAPRLAFGAAAGALAGVLLGLALRIRRLVPETLDNIFVLGAVLVLFELSNAVLSETGVLAVTVAGVVLGNFHARIPRGLREFKGYLTEALIGLLFVLLAADVGTQDLTALGWRGVATVGTLMFLVRPVNVALSTARTNLAFRERAFIAWLGPRGIVAAAIASLAAAYMHSHELPGGDSLRALVFLTIGVTVVVQGGLGGLVARALRVRVPERDAVLILGAEGLGLALAEELRAGGRPVIFLDSNPDHCRLAGQQGYPVVFGNALEERTFTRARPELADAVVGLTPNETVNLLFAREAREEFRVPHAYVAVARADRSVPEHMLERHQGRILFDRPKDVARWNVRFRHGQTRQLRLRYRESKEPAGEVDADRPPPQRPDAHVILTVERGGRVMPMHADLELREGDEASVAVYLDQEADALATLAALGWEPIPPEPPPEPPPES